MPHDHAVVIGGGIAGLLAAHVSSEHFRRVTILDRDELPERPGPRRGVPQGRHLHILMARGLRAFEELLPGFRHRLSSAGAGILDFAADTALCLPAGWMPRHRSGVEVHACTRDLLEWTLRRRVLESDRVEVSTGGQVTGLVATPDRRGITGVQLPDATIDADLVIDASGRGSKAPRWLEDLGRSEVARTTVDAPIDYGSRWYEAPAGDEPDWRLLAISPRYPSIRRSGTVLRVEGDRWNVLLLGLDGESVPTDDDGFADFARGLASPRIHEFIERARPLSPIHRYASNDSRIHHYERVPDWPSGFACLGDSVCALNPYAGLGMTACALGALTLREHLRGTAEGDLPGLGPRFQARLAEVNRPAWEIATNQHLRWPDDHVPTTQRPPLGPYLDGVMTLAVRHPEVATTVLEVMHMLEPPTALFTPRMQQRVAEMRRAEAPETTRAP